MEQKKSKLNLMKRIIRSKPYRMLTSWMKQVHFVNEELSLYLITAILIKKLKSNDISVKANAVAFNFTLAIFPSIIFLFTLVPYLPIENLRDQLFVFFNDVAPNSMHATIKDTVIDIVSKPRGNLLSFGFLSALYLASNGVIALMDAFNSCYHTNVKKQNFFQKRVIATMLTFLLSFILFLTIVALISGKVILDTLVSYDILSENYIYYMINVLRYVIVIIMFFLVTSTLYYFAPSIPSRWSFMSVGAIIATTLIILFSVAFSFYIDNFGTYNKLYGSIGVMLGVMLWLLAVSHVLLLGFEVNSTIDIARDRLKQLQQEMEESIEGDTSSGWHASNWREAER